MTDQKESARKRKAAERARKKEAGLVRLELWVKPEHRQAVVDFYEGLKIYGDKHECK